MGKRSYKVVTESEGFVLIGTGVERVYVPWLAVREITAYKLDLITTDEVRLRFDLDILPFSIEVSEEMEGFEDFKTTVERYFQFSGGWWSQVLQPPFARNECVLFQRGG
ncbi:MAG TPA: hypothetical protein DEQ40_16105 [Oxalobacteraceae bacterium]|jgi:hypothetical protein|nr:hypothetical protein [Oxalobacteraceae bacterium]